MEKIWLRVQTVSAWDPITLQGHTAFDVIYQDGEKLLDAPGWTLRDAIENYCRWFHIARENVAIQRPFFPQRSSYYE